MGWGARAIAAVSTPPLLEVATKACSSNCKRRKVSCPLFVIRRWLGRSIFNNCNNGDTSADLIDRFNQVLAVKAKYVLIALNLDSEVA